MTVTALIANFTVPALLVGGTLSAIINLTSLLLASRTRDGLTDAVGVAHFTGLALSAAFALRTFGVFTDGFGAAAALDGAMVLSGTSSPEAMVHIGGICVPVSPGVVPGASLLAPAARAAVLVPAAGFLVPGA